jgi:heme A synthase
MTKSRFIRYSWFVLGYNILVILWGAFVRATGSGAGCGRHWPLCNGVVVPRPEQIETVIEFSHRVSSALAGVFVIILLVWAYRAFPRQHPARTGARWSLIFILIEGALGAALVRFELVADNASAARAAVVAVHLVNTFILIGWLALTGWWARTDNRLQLRDRGSLVWLLAIGMLGMMFIGGSGAITALGDTLFPAGSLIEGIQQDLSPTAHFLIQLRIWHPVIAVVVGVYLFAIAGMIRNAVPEAAQATRVVHAIFFVQLILGAINVLLLAPVWMQLVHLLVADILWIAFVLMSAAALAAPVPRAAPVASYAAD